MTTLGRPTLLEKRRKCWVPSQIYWRRVNGEILMEERDCPKARKTQSCLKAR